MYRKILLLLAVFFLVCGNSYSAEQDRWTLAFEKDCSVSDALKHLRDITKVRISITGEITGESVSRTSYSNADIDEILAGLLSRKNYTVTWKYVSGRLESADVEITGTKIADAKESELRKPDVSRPESRTGSGENPGDILKYIPDDPDMPIIYHRPGDDVAKMEEKIRDLIYNPPDSGNNSFPLMERR